MLSICIPSFSKNTCEIIDRLHCQAKELNEEIEILIATSQTNLDSREVNMCEKFNIKTVTVYRNNSLHENIYALAQNARGSYLLLLQSNIVITSKQYLAKLFELMQPGLIIDGGFTVQGKCTSNEHKITWQAYREAICKNATQRAQYPYFNLSINNLLIPRGIFLQMPIQDFNIEYRAGLEFSFLLKKNNNPVLHIDNPIAITKYPTNIRFFVQTRKFERESAIWLLKHNDDDEILNTFEEYRYYNKLRKMKLANIYKVSYTQKAKHIISKLYKEKANINDYRNFKTWAFIYEYTKYSNLKYNE